MGNKHENIRYAEIPFTPADAGYDPSRLQVLDNFLYAFLEKNKLQCAGYLLRRNDKIFAHAAMGRLDYREDKPGPFQLDSIRGIASITKIFTATAIGKLIEDGLLTLADPVALHLEEFDTSLHKKITILQLLTHTSGLMPDNGCFDTPYTYEWWAAIKSFDNNWIKAFLSGHLFAPPGTQWAYCSMGFSILGEIIHRVTGIKPEDYIMENIIRPLGLEDTYFDVPQEKWNRICCSNEWNIPENKEKRKQEEEVYIPAMGGGLSSTLKDMSIFGQMLLNKGTYQGVRIIGRKSVEYMTMNQIFGVRSRCWGADEDKYWGAGFEVVEKLPFHSTSVSTFSHEGYGASLLIMDPVEQLTAVLIMPFVEDWFHELIWNTRNIIWSGLI